MSAALARRWDFFDDEDDEVLIVEEPEVILEDDFEQYDEDDEQYDETSPHYYQPVPPLPLERPLYQPAFYSYRSNFSLQPRVAPPQPKGGSWFGGHPENPGLAEAVYVYGAYHDGPPARATRPALLDTAAGLAVNFSRSRMLALLVALFAGWMIISYGMNWLAGRNRTSLDIYSFGGGIVAPVGQNPTDNKAPAGGSGIEGKPSITVATIEEVLRKYNSPASGTGQTMYDLGLKYNIDPAYALAFFIHESSAGTKGIAVNTRSIGNIRQTANSGFEAYQGFRKYPSWEAGIEDWYKLIRNLYIQGWNLRTVEAIIPKYAPTADNNNEAAYISHVNRMVAEWRSGK